MQPPIKTFTTEDGYEDPNRYKVHLNKMYTNVKSARLISTEIPNTDTIINLCNNQLRFQLKNVSTTVLTGGSSPIWEFFVSPGNYTPSELAAELDIEINKMVDTETGGLHKNVFSITADETKNTFEISVADTYTFVWEFIVEKDMGVRNLHDMLGFPTNKKSVYGTSFSNLVKVGYNLVPFKPFRLKKCDYLWMSIKTDIDTEDGFDHIYDNLTNDFYFAKILLDDVKHNETAYNTFIQTAKVYDITPEPHLSELLISFYDEFGHLYNFGQVEHSFTVEIVHHMDRLMGNDYSSRRGMTDKTSYL